MNEDKIAELEARIKKLEDALCTTHKRQGPGALSKEFHPRPEDMEWAAKEFPNVEADRETEKFRDYWISRGKRLTNWHAAWRNWIRKAAVFAAQTPQQHGNQGRSPSRVADTAARNRERGAGALDLLSKIREGAGRS